MTLNVAEMTPDQAYKVLERLAKSEMRHPEYPDRLWRPTVMLHGEPGVGKSTLVRKLSRDLFGKKPIVVNAALIEATDLKGLPDLDRQNAVTRWLKPDFLPRDKDDKGVIFFDEATQGRRDVMAAMYPILLDRELDDWTCPEGYLIVCAGNDVEDGAIANDMGTALNDRLFHIKVVSGHKATIAHLSRKDHAHPAVLALLEQNPSMLNMNKERIEHGYVASPTPRSWEETCLALNMMLPDMTIIKSREPAHVDECNLVKAFVSGRIGESSMQELFATMLDMTECKDVSYMLENHDKLKAEDYPTTPRGVRGLCYQIALMVKTEAQARAAFNVLYRFRQMQITGFNIREFTAMGLEIIIEKMTKENWLNPAMDDKGPFGVSFNAYLEEASAKYLQQA